MHSLKFLIIAASLAAVPAMAQDAAAPAAAAADAGASVKKGAMVFSADGSRFGRINDIRGNLANIIFDGRFVKIPVETLSNGERGLTTSLTRKEVGKR